MFGIIYGLFTGCIYCIGGIKDDIDNKKCKEKYYNPQTETYIDSRGCTRDYKTDEPRIVTSQWNKEKKRYEKIVLKNGTQIVKNVTEEEDKHRGITYKSQTEKDNEPYVRPVSQWEIDYKKRKEENKRKEEERKKRKEELLKNVRRPS